MPKKIEVSVVLVAMAFAACGGGDETSGASTTTTVASSSSGGGAGGAGGGEMASSSTGIVTVPDCAGTSPDNPGAKVAVGTVKVKVQDQNGKALSDSDIDVQLCGSDLCLYGKSSDGTYSISNGGKELVDPALKYGSQTGLSYLFWGGTLPAAPDHDFGTITAVALGAPGGKLEKGATVSSAGVTLELDPDARIEQELLAPEDEFAAVVFKPVDGTFPPLAATTQSFDLIVGLGPADVDICPPAKLSFPNSEGWAANAQVELWVNGVKTYDNWAPYGTWSKVADATVSADGKTIATVAGQGVPALAAYGVVLKN